MTDWMRITRKKKKMKEKVSEVDEVIPQKKTKKKHTSKKKDSKEIKQKSN